MQQKLFPVMNLLHGSMIFGLLLFFGVILFLQHGTPAYEANFSSPLIYIALLLVTFVLAFHFLLYPGRLDKIRSTET